MFIGSFVLDLRLYESLLPRVERIPGFECWIWMGGVRESSRKPGMPYGRIRIKKRSVAAHRAMWIAVHGDPGPLVICHTCDVPLCINPAHLFAGTQRENALDCIAKGRYRSPITARSYVRAKGERAAATKLTEAQARRAKFGGERISVLAREFDVSDACIDGIRHGRNWRHLEAK